MTSLILLVVSNLVFYALLVGLARYWFGRSKKKHKSEPRPEPTGTRPVRPKDKRRNFDTDELAGRQE